MIRFIYSVILASICMACSSTTPASRYFPQPGQGQYRQPQYLTPAPPPPVRPLDSCNAQFYRGLVGQHEGVIQFGALPLPVRVLKPSATEETESELLPQILTLPAFVEVRDFLPGQEIYGPSVSTVTDISVLNDFDAKRINIELAADGYVQQIRCG